MGKKIYEILEITRQQHFYQRTTSQMYNLTHRHHETTALTTPLHLDITTLPGW